MPALCSPSGVHDDVSAQQRTRVDRDQVANRLLCLTWMKHGCAKLRSVELRDVPQIASCRDRLDARERDLQDRLSEHRQVHQPAMPREVNRVDRAGGHQPEYPATASASPP